MKIIIANTINYIIGKEDLWTITTGKNVSANFWGFRSSCSVWPDDLGIWLKPRSWNKKTICWSKFIFPNMFSIIELYLMDALRVTRSLCVTTVNMMRWRDRVSGFCRSLCSQLFVPMSQTTFLHIRCSQEARQNDAIVLAVKSVHIKSRLLFVRGLHGVTLPNTWSDTAKWPIFSGPRRC